MRTRLFLIYLALTILLTTIYTDSAFSQNSGPLKVPASGDVFILQDGKLTEMEYVAGFTKNMTSIMITRKMRLAIIADEEHGQLRVRDKNPVFYIRVHPSEIGIVKFDADTYNKKKVRYAILVTEIGSNRGDFLEKNNIEFDYNKETTGLYKITPKKPITSGEYGIITVGGAAGYRIFDFGVDEE